MADCIAAPGPQFLEDVGTDNLQGVSLPDPTDPAWTIAGLTTSGAVTSLADPRPDAFSKLSLRGDGHDAIWFDRIHIFPRERDLGAVVSEQEIIVEVYSAFRDRAKTLDEITVEGPQGIEVVDHLGQPAHFAATQSEVYSVLVSAEGDPTIDNLITWDFDGISNDGTSLSLAGYRMIPFMFEANMAATIRERIGYTTDLMTSHSGNEQRVQLRSKPTGTISYQVTLIDDRASQMAVAILYGNQARVFGVPRWQYRSRLVSDTEIEDVDVYLPTANLPYSVGGLVMLWTSPFDWEVQTIEEVHADHLVLSSGLRFAWTSHRTSVVPVVIGRLSAQETLSWESLKIVSQAPTFLVEVFDE